MRSVTCLLDRLDSDELIRVPSLGNLCQEASTVTSDIQDPPRWGCKPILPDMVDHRHPEHLVTNLEIFLVYAIVEEPRAHDAPRTLLRGNAVDCNLELAHSLQLDQYRNAE
jgi:hypothetical protein